MPASRIACLLPCDPEPDERTLEALADAAAGFSPQVEQAAEAVYLEVGDLGRLFPTEEQLLQAMEGAVAEVGAAAYIAIASDKGVARVRARGLLLGRSQRRAAVVLRGGERAALAPLPIETLDPAPEQRLRLESWGLRTVGELANLPRPAVVTRLGAAGSVLHRLASGESSELLKPSPPPPEIREEQELLDALENLEPLLFVLRGLLDRLVARLRARSQACGDLVIRLSLSPRGEETRRVAVAAPTQKVAALLELVRVALEGQPPKGHVERIALVTVPARQRFTQLDLFTPAGPAPEKLATTLARLEALCGQGRVGQPLVPDTYTPGAAAQVAFAPPQKPQPLATEEEALEVPQRLLAARTVRPAQPVVVSRRGDELTQLVFESSRLPGVPKPQAVRRSGGPYRLADVSGVRDYYDVELADGELLRLFYDLTAERWYLDAVYD